MKLLLKGRRTWPESLTIRSESCESLPQSRPADLPKDGDSETPSMATYTSLALFSALFLKLLVPAEKV